MNISPATGAIVLTTVAILCTASSCTPVAPVAQPTRQILTVPAEPGDCTITLTGIKKGNNQQVVYKMGYNAPMPKLKIFLYAPQGESAEISFDGVGDGCAVHFNGTIRLTQQTGKTYHFTSTAGEMKGFAPENFEATPTHLTITLNPNE